MTTEPRKPVPQYEDLEAMRRYGEATRELLERLASQADVPLGERGFGTQAKE